MSTVQYIFALISYDCSVRPRERWRVRHTPAAVVISRFSYGYFICRPEIIVRNDRVQDLRGFFVRLE